MINANADKVKELSDIVNSLKRQVETKDKVINELAKEIENINSKLDKPNSSNKIQLKDKIDSDIYDALFYFDVNRVTGEPCKASNEKANRNFHVFVKNLILVCGYTYSGFNSDDNKYHIRPRSFKKMPGKEFERFAPFVNKILKEIYEYKRDENERKEFM